MKPEPANRKTQILDAVTQMLRQPYAARITTAALAAHLGLSEGALYRHFENKSAIFDALITRIETQLCQDLSHTDASEPDARRRLRKQAHALLLFAQRHPGLTNILIGHALVAQDPRLQMRCQALITQFRQTLAQSAQALFAQPDGAAADRLASLLMHWVAGRWLAYAHSGWTAQPTQDYEQELDLITPVG